jgi:hypothetical protein
MQWRPTCSGGQTGGPAPSTHACGTSLQPVSIHPHGGMRALPVASGVLQGTEGGPKNLKSPYIPSAPLVA